MNFPTPLIPALLVQRYKRFLADVKLEDGSVITVHCPNPGAMAGLKDPGNQVWISDSGNPARKLRYTLEMMEVGKVMVGLNTNRANALAREAMEAGLVDGIDPSWQLLAEQKYGTSSRIDFLARNPSGTDTYVEVKNVHFMREPGLHEFPDSVTARGAKHLDELMAMVDAGHEGLMLFMIQRNDGDQFTIASDIDKLYGERFHAAIKTGVKVQAVCCNVSPTGITPVRTVEIIR